MTVMNFNDNTEYIKSLLTGKADKNLANVLDTDFLNKMKNNGFNPTTIANKADKNLSNVDNAIFLAKAISIGLGKGASSKSAFDIGYLRNDPKTLDCGVYIVAGGYFRYLIIDGQSSSTSYTYSSYDYINYFDRTYVSNYLGTDNKENGVGFLVALKGKKPYLLLLTQKSVGSISSSTVLGSLLYSEGNFTINGDTFVLQYANSAQGSISIMKVV